MKTANIEKKNKNKMWLKYSYSSSGCSISEAQ